MIGPLVLVAVFLLAVFLPRIGGLAFCVALLCSGCTEVAQGHTLRAAFTFANGILFLVFPFYIHQLTKPNRSRSTTEQ